MVQIFPISDHVSFLSVSFLSLLGIHFRYGTMFSFPFSGKQRNNTQGNHTCSKMVKATIIHNSYIAVFHRLRKIYSADDVTSTNDVIQEAVQTPKKTAGQDQEASGSGGGSGSGVLAQEGDGPDNCAKQPCKNSGTCINDYNRIDGYRCQCQDDFGGINCEGKTEMYRNCERWSSPQQKKKHC